MQKEDIKIINLTFVNAFLVRVKDGFILVDTGLSMHWERLESELISAGCLPDKLKLVIITHGDFDHTGNCAKLQQKYKCKIAMHKNDTPMAEEGVRVKRKTKTFMAKLFVMIRMMNKKKFTYDKFKPDIILSEGQSLKEYGFNATIVHIPGHTKGSIGIITEDGDLFAGDTFNNRKKPGTATYIENQQELDSSISRLKKMNIKTVYPGHGDPFKMQQLA